MISRMSNTAEQIKIKILKNILTKTKKCNTLLNITASESEPNRSLKKANVKKCRDSVNLEFL